MGVSNINPQEEMMFQQMQLRNLENQANNTKLNSAVTLFSERDDSENLIKWQFNVEQSLIRIERTLRKQVPKRDPKTGGIYYADCPQNQLLNEYGINEIMNLLSTYVNKEIILSCYDDKQINRIMEQFGEEVIDFVYTNMEKFGLDTEEKKKHYPIVVMNIINLVDATYRKSLNGLTLENLKTARVVNQTEPLMKNMNYPSIGKKFNILNPKTWKA